MASQNKLGPIPHPPKQPVIGNMLSVDATAPVQDLVKKSKELGPIFWLDMMGTPMVIVSGAALVDELSDEKRFDKAVRGPLRRIRALAGDGLFTADTTEPNWGKAHNILMTPFGNRAMQSYHPMMVDIAEQLVKKWERLNADEEIDVVHDMTALTLDTIGLCGFDYRFNSFYRRDYHPYVAALVRSLETVMSIRGIPLEGLLLRGRKNQMGDDIAFMNKMVDEIVAERRKNAEAAASKKDMLAAMVSGVDRASGERLDDVNIRYQINTFLIAGHETTSGLLSCAIYAMLKHPEVLRKAYEEVDRVLGPDLDIKPTYQQVTQLTYITQILKEALRLWPPAPAFGMSPLQDETIGGQYKLRKGTFVTVLVLALHRDPSVWGPNPDLFDPENFGREAEAKRPVNAWKPFGNGQRACIGRGFAMHEAALALGMILQRFKLVDHTGYQMLLKETLTIKPDGFKIKVRPRTDPDRTHTNVTRAASPAQAAAAPVATVRPRPGHNTPLMVLYGSNLGTAEDIAHRIADLAEVNGFATTLAPLDDMVGKLPDAGGVIIICASYNGAPPDNATQFVKWISGDLPKDAFAKVRYAVFGCGNSDWLATYQSIPRLIDEQLTAHGATSACARGEGDARDDLDGQFETWFKQLRALAVKEFGVDTGFQREANDAPLYQVEPVATSIPNTIAGLGGAAPIKIVVNDELQTHNGPGGRSTRHIEVQLSENMTYRVGDHLSVVPRNDPELVDRVARRFGFLSTDQIRLGVAEGRRAQLPVGQPVSVGRLLAEFVELQQVATRKQIQIMSEHTRCPVTRPKLEAMAGEDAASNELYRAEVLAKRKSVFNLLEEYPACELPFNTYLEMLSLLSPRYYSISSSPQAAGASRCSITTAVVEAPAISGRGTYKGICSNYLAGRRVGETIHATVKETKAGFRLPDDSSAPVIMVGPGTGLAPFRGFLQERAARKGQGQSLGPAMLFFGCRHPDQDFLYAKELQQFAADGVSELHVGFSRGDGPKTYVQHLIAAQKDRVWSLIEQGAIIYVCGDGGKMEPDVKAALVAIYRERKGASEEEGLRWIDDMGTQNRYVLDVWAGS